MKAEEIREAADWISSPSSGTHRRGQEAGPDDSAGDLLRHVLLRAAELAHDYPELVEEHDRSSCADYTCSLMGAIADLAGELQREKQQCE